MWFVSRLRNRNRFQANERSRTRRPIGQRARVLGRLEVLEDRSMLSFGSPISVSFGSGMSPTHLATGDVNHDGKADLIAAVNGGIEVTLGKGSGHFSKPAFYPSASGTQIITALAVADINGDGKLDVIAGNVDEGASISVLLGNGNGSFVAAFRDHNLEMSSAASSLAVADFDSDGKPDIAASGFDGEVDVMFNDGGLWDRQTVYNLPVVAGGSPSTVAAGDFSDDGKPDLVVAGGTSSVYVLLNTGSGSFAAPQSYAVGGDTADAVIGDFNGDGRLDIATANGASNSISVLLNNGDGTFLDPLIRLVQGPASTIAAGDFDKDGKLDIVVSGAETDVLLGHGDGTFAAAQTVGPAGNNVLVTDVNGDGFPDLAQIDGSGTSIDVFLNNADWRPKGHK